jgi:tRNA(Ile)-lysidine synthase
MLKIEKDEIYEYIEKHKLKFIHDHSNEDEQFDRNFIRNRLMPLISERWPAAVKKISDLSELSKKDIEFKNIFLEQRIEEFRSESGLDILSLSKVSENERTYIIRYWIKKSGFPQPNRKIQLEIEKIFFCSQTTSISSVQWKRADNEQKSCKMTTDKKSLIIKEQ